MIFYGDIKSQGVVKNRTNRNLNRDINNIKFYNFKERLLFKSIERRKKVYCVKEHYTTQTCSFCGVINKPGMSKKYNCSSCKNTVGRDINASKNILMKGIIQIHNLRSLSSSSFIVVVCVHCRCKLESVNYYKH